MPTSEVSMSKFSHLQRAGDSRLWRKKEMHVMRVDQSATNVNGRIILGMTLPCIRQKVGHLECLSRSRGPCYTG